MKDDQEQAVRYLCDGPNLRAMTGNAGTGKTFTLQAVREAYEAAGRKVFGCALQGSAAEELQAKSGIPSDTLKRTLYRLDKGYLRFDAETVVVCDEAGTVGTVMMTRLLQHALRAGAKVLLVGDAKQLQPIEAGGPFKHLCGLIGDVLLKRILRQADPTRHAAIEAFAYGRSREALADFIKRGELHELPTKAKAIDRMVERWVVDGGPLNPERVLMLANLNHDVRTINRKCQAIRIELRRVDPERRIAANGELFHEGDILQFTKIDRKRGIQNANTAAIHRRRRGERALTVRLDKDARVLEIPVMEYGTENIRLAYATTTHKSQGKSVERAHVLIGGSLEQPHSAYVQASRAIYKTELYVSSDHSGPEYRNITRALARDMSKDLAHDVAVAPVGAGPPPDNLPPLSRAPRRPLALQNPFPISFTLWSFLVGFCRFPAPFRALGLSPSCSFERPRYCPACLLFDPLGASLLPPCVPLQLLSSSVSPEPLFSPPQTRPDLSTYGDNSSQDGLKQGRAEEGT